MNSTTLESKLTLAAFLEQPETKPASEFINGETIQKPMPQAILRTKFEQVLSLKPRFNRGQDLIIKVRGRANFEKIARSWNCKP